jgi:hypothetical protein
VVREDLPRADAVDQLDQIVGRLRLGALDGQAVASLKSPLYSSVPSGRVTCSIALPRT